MININLNTLLYTNVEHSPTKTVYIRYYMGTHTLFYTHVQHSPTKMFYIRYYMETHTHTHTHNVCSTNWVLILVGVEIP